MTIKANNVEPKKSRVIEGLRVTEQGTRREGNVSVCPKGKEIARSMFLPGGVCLEGVLQRLVRMLLECILVVVFVQLKCFSLGLK